jgi:hypothetical protein
MKLNRRVNQKLANRNAGIPDVRLATSRPMSPEFWWRDQNMPYDISDPEELKKLRGNCRFLYATHQTISSCTDLFASFPVAQMEFRSKDPAVTDFFTDHFLAEDGLNYKQYFIDILTDYFLLGEAWPLGTFSESLGVWEDDELMDPDDIEVETSPFLKEPRFKMKLPETIRTILYERKPENEYKKLISSYPELKHFIATDDHMPVSNILLRQLRLKFPHNPRGVPILMRAIRNLIKEEMLSSAQDAVASRLYTPFILAKLGATAQDLGTQRPWIPNEGDRDAFMAALDAAMSGDFRMLVYHFAVDIKNVFGRETIPDLSGDFDRIEDRTLQVFGLSKTAISGASSGETYAADALNLDLAAIRLRSAQNAIQSFYRSRALVVAEAQEMYDFETRGEKRYPVMEEILEVDPDTGEKTVVEQPKLLIPELRLKPMSLKTEKEVRDFLEQAAGTGVPISLKTRFTNIPVDLDEEREAYKDEAVEMEVAEQERRLQTYKALKEKGLLSPELHGDLIRDFGEPEEQPVIPDFSDGEQPSEDPTVTDPSAEGEDDESEDGNVVVPMPKNKIKERAEREYPSRPPESDERRAEMPKPAMRVTATNSEGGIIVDRHQKPLKVKREIEEGGARLISGPSHVGMRRYAEIDPDEPLA